MRHAWHVLVLSLWWLACASCLHAKESEEGIAFFENKIRPVLVQHCHGCHASDARSIKGGLLLDTKAGLLKGGDSGAAVVPHDPDDSLLLSALRYEDYEMPPKGRLSDAVIADFEKWIRMGAPDPRKGETVTRRKIDIDEGRTFWAFQALDEPNVPQDETQWARSDVDRFVAAKHTEHGLSPAGDAPDAMWLRRVSFDLTGLPPTRDALRAFLADERPDRREHAVDGLLDSQHFGERWGRHWLDLARFAESTGRTRNYPYPFAWRYRDYVIDSFNGDKPLDQFVTEQLAGDLLPADDHEHRTELLVATGFLAVGSPDLNERDTKVFKMDTVADQIDTVSRGLLGLTVGCARCHDHKFDPIPTEDYYALAGIFQSTQRLNGYAGRVGGGNQMRPALLISLDASQPSEAASKLTPDEELVLGLDEKKAANLLKAKRAVDVVRKKMNRIRSNKKLKKGQRNAQLAVARKELTKKNQQFVRLRNRYNNSRDIKIDGPMCMGVRDETRIADCKVHIRGDTRKLGDAVPRGFLQVISDGQADIPDNQSGRIELAAWITSSENPLTARVFVNRVWYQLFGRGLVRTVDNFGVMGAEPSHPELLDYLAARFIQHGWSVKQLIRSLVLSRTYGLDVTYDAHNAAIDADNTFCWRMNARRLDYEAMRDAILHTSGTLVTTRPTGSVVETLKMNELSRQRLKPDNAVVHHRAVYQPVLRNLLPAEATAFDMPDASETRGARDTTTVPTQSLYLMNSPFMVQHASEAAKRFLSMAGEDAANAAVAQIAYETLFGRSASDEEVTRLCGYVATRHSDGQSRETAWSEAVHAMYASAEFRYR